GDVVGDVAIRIVPERFCQLTWATRRERDRLVHTTLLPPSRPPIVEAELVVRIPVGRAEPAAEVPRDARYAIALGRRRVEDALNLPREVRRDTFVGVDGKNPVVPGVVCGEVLLGGIPGPGVH